MGRRTMGLVPTSDFRHDRAHSGMSGGSVWDGEDLGRVGRNGRLQAVPTTSSAQWGWDTQRAAGS